MGLLDQFSGILKQYTGGTAPANPNDALEHYDQVAAQAHPNDVSGALGSIFRSPQTGSFGQNVASMFGQSDPTQRAGILNTMLASGAGAGVLSQLGLGSSTTQVSPEQAQQIAPSAVEAAANHAEQHDPSIIDRASDFYSQHPTLVKAMGASAALLAMRHFSDKA